MKKILRYAAIAFAAFMGLIILAAILIPSEKLKDPQVADEKALTKGAVSEEAKPDTVNIAKPLNKFDYKFPQSDYSFPVEINKITTSVVKDAYVEKADEYSPEVKIDGYILKIKFKMTNPYDKSMMAPVPNYYYISSLNKEYFSSSTTFYKQCQCKIDNSTKVTDFRGRELWKLSEGKCGYGDYCIKFSPRESKEFTVTFTDPIIKDVRKLIFHSFHYEGYDYQHKKDRDKVFVIDVDKKAIVDEIQL